MSGSIDEFIEDLTKRDFIVFAGAGISTLTGIHKWRELLEALNKRTNIAGVEIADVDTIHYPEIAQMIYDSLEKEGRINEYYKVIRESMQPSKCAWHSGHKAIIRASSSIVTTNLDGTFESALVDELQSQPRGVAVNKKVKHQTLSKLDFERITRPCYITYLHGRYDEEKIILKTSDYVKYYGALSGGKKTKLERVLRKIFCQREAIVFAGFSFGDRFVLQTFERGFREIGGKVINQQETENLHQEEINHYAFMEDPVRGGEDRERWLLDNVNTIKKETEDWRDLIKVKERTELEKRLRGIHIKVIRYPYEHYVEIEPYFKGIYNKKRSVQDFVKL
jgi:hypothetical protein